MKLDITHHYPCTPEVFWEMFWDDDYDQRLSEGTAVTRQLIEEWEEDGQRCWRMRFIPDRELPRPVAKLLGSDKLVYDQKNRLDEANNTLHWEVIPTVLADKVVARGRMFVVPNDGGCDRVVKGEVTVNVPLVGGRIEKTILANVAESYDRAVEAALEWLSERG